MTVVVDTSILVDQLRGNPSAGRLLAGARRGGERLAASALTKIEVLAGVRAGEETVTERLLAQFEWVPVDEELADRAGRLARQWLRSHPGVEVTDYAIAALAQQLGAELWTRNLKHFPMFPELRAPYE